MASSNVTMSLPSISRRALLAGIAMSPCAAGAMQLSVGSRTAFAAKRDAYILAEAAYRKMAEPFRLACDKAEPFRLAWVDACQNRESVRDRLVRRALMEGIPASEWSSVIDGLRGTSASGLPIGGDQVERLRSVRRGAETAAMQHPEMIEAIDREKEATSSLNGIRQSAGYDSLSDVVEAAGNRLSAATLELEVARPANLGEFLQKLEILAVHMSGSSFEFADFYDLAMSDLAPLAGIQIEPVPEIEDLPRGTCWGGGGCDGNEGDV